MEQKYVVRFARDDPETPPTMEPQIALARVRNSLWRRLRCAPHKDRGG